MQNSELQQTIAPDSSVLSAMDTKTERTETRTYEYRKLASMWSSLEPEIQRALWKSDPLIPPIINSLYWMWNHTKTCDPQDPSQSYKPFPADRPYLKVLHKVWIKAPIMFVEKSRTMLASWWIAAETLHWVMSRQPAKGIFWALDEDRAIALLDYAKTLYEQQDAIFKTIFPLDRPLDRQAYNRLEFKDGGLLIALPGKDPDKIRSEHPTIVIIDEAAFIQNGGESFDIALSSRVPKMACISSAAPGWFYNMTKDARPVPLEKYL
jgi:hypothetical protein